MNSNMSQSMPIEIGIHYDGFKTAMCIFEIIFGVENLYKAIDNTIDRICKDEDELFIKKTKLRFKLLKNMDKFYTNEPEFISILLLVI